MREIIKSQLFQLRRKRLTAAVFILLCGLMLLRVFFASNVEGMTGSAFMAEELSFIVFVAYMFVFLAAGVICADDFSDKTVNMELMGGHTRNEVYFGRAVPCVIVSAAGATFIAALPVAAAAAVFGWGGQISAGQVIVRFLLIALIFTRMGCEMTFLSFTVKNPYIVFALGYLAFMFVQTFMPGASVITSYNSLNIVTAFDGWMIYGLSGDFHSVYSGGMKAADIISAAAASVIFGGLFLAMGRVFFENDDLN